MTYATVSDVQDRTLRELSDNEQNLARKLLEDAAVIIDMYAPAALEDVKKIVSCRIGNTVSARLQPNLELPDDGKQRRAVPRENGKADAQEREQDRKPEPG